MARYDLRLPSCRSLKDKRAVMRPLLASVQQRHHCSVAEVDHQDLQQRATIGVAIVSGSHFHARKVLQEIGRSVEMQPGVELLQATEDVIGADDR